MVFLQAYYNNSISSIKNGYIHALYALNPRKLLITMVSVSALFCTDKVPCISMVSQGHSKDTSVKNIKYYIT